jgi:hypothetical protein
MTQRLAAVRGGVAVLGVLGVLCGVAAPGEARAQGSQVPVAVPVTVPSSEQTPRDIPRLHTFYRVGIAARYNPVGLFTNAAFLLRYRLYDSDALALKDNYIGVGPVAFISPAFYRAGIGVEVQPASVLNLSASYEWTGFFGNFNFLQSFPTIQSNYSDAELARLAAPNAPAATAPQRASGTLFTVAGLLQLKAGPVALRSNARLFNFNLNVRNSEPVFYEPVLDVALPNGGWGLTNDTDLLFVGIPRFAIGARYSGSGGFFRPTDGDLSHPNARPQHRVGPFLAYTFSEDDRNLINTPTLVLLSQWFLQHPYRTATPALPWLAVGFQFRGIP